MLKLTTNDLYAFDSTILDSINLAPITEDIKATLLMDCKTFHTVFGNPKVAKYCIGIWWKDNEYNFRRIYETETADYNPIWNKDGKVTYGYTKKNTGTVSNKNNGADTTTNNSTDTKSTVGYNVAEAKKAEVNETHGGTKIAYDSGQMRTDDTTETWTDERIEQGNIGLTSSQQLMIEEYNIRKVNVITRIVASYKKAFCVGLY